MQGSTWVSVADLGGPGSVRGKWKIRSVPISDDYLNHHLKKPDTSRAVIPFMSTTVPENPVSVKWRRRYSNH